MAVHSVLSDGTLRRLVAEGHLKVTPWDERMVQPASIDLKLGPSFRVFHNHRITAIDLADPPRDLTEHVAVPADAPFVIHPGEFVLGRTEEHVTLPADLVARIEGKALALDTEVPTPGGWRTMGDLRVGDEVFDELGRPTRVVGTTAPLRGRRCFALRLCDGTEVVADAEHRWATRTGYERRHGAWPTERTTEQLRTALRAGGDGGHLVEQAHAVRYPAKELPVDPYVLGAWLGDATTAAVHPRSLREPEAVGVGAPGSTRAPSAGRSPLGPLGSELRGLGVLGERAIPEEFLQGSVRQRRDLLDGLMDTGGSVDDRGRCTLSARTRRSAAQYAELIAGLGFRPVVAATPADDHRGSRHEVRFTPHRAVFRLPRKANRQRLTQRFELGRTVTAVAAVESVPVRCIEVASPRGLFLVTRRFVPTHNSSLGRLGLIVHATAGFVDPGFSGTLTLEITNFNSVPIVLRPGLPVAQLSLMALDRPAERPYGHPELGSHYHGQVEATESRYEGGPAPVPAPGAPARSAPG